MSLRSNPKVTADWRRRSKRIKPVSDKQFKNRGEKAKVRELVYARDDYRCLLNTGPLAGSCLGDLTPHHLRKGGQGGGYTLENLVTLCAHHNSWVEDYPRIAQDLGLVVLNGYTLEWAWTRMRERGLVP